MTTEKQKAAEKTSFDYIAYTVEKRGKIFGNVSDLAIKRRE